MRFFRQNLPALTVVLIMFALSSYFFGVLPAELPIHFAANGTPDQFASKSFVLIFYPVLTLALIIIQPLLLAISPNGFQLEEDGRPVGKVNFALSILFAALLLATILPEVDPGRFEFAQVASIGFGLFMLIFGNYLGKVRPNFFIGIRTPWTITSEDNWLRTHRMAGKTVLFSGILTCLAALTGAPFMFCIGLLIFAFLSPVIYSLVLHLKSRNRPLTSYQLDD
jgi:uncharacterized membrane protein